MRWRYKFPLRLRSLLRKGKAELELSDELQCDLQNQIDGVLWISRRGEVRQLACHKTATSPILRGEAEKALFPEPPSWRTPGPSSPERNVRDFVEEVTRSRDTTKGSTQWFAGGCGSHFKASRNPELPLPVLFPNQKLRIEGGT